MRFALFVGSLFSLSFFTLGGEIAKCQENINEMMKVTVTGTKSKSTVKDYAGSVDVIDKNIYDKSPSTDIRNLLRDVPGVTTQRQ